MFKLTPFTTSVKRRSDYDDFYNLVDDFFSTPFRSLAHDKFKIDVKEEENRYIIEADVPGVKKEEVKLSYQDDVLTISIDRQEQTESDNEGYLHRERRVCSMKRALNLTGLDPKNIKAKLEDGVLTVTAEKVKVEEHSYVIEVE